MLIINDKTITVIGNMVEELISSGKIRKIKHKELAKFVKENWVDWEKKNIENMFEADIKEFWRDKLIEKYRN